MSKGSTPDVIASAVLLHLQRARTAVGEQNIDGVIDALREALAVYERNPSAVHAPAGQLLDLLVFIRSARTLCKTLRRPDDDLRDLEDRAEALRRPLH